MKEIIKHVDGVAGRVVTITGLTETTMSRDNVLGILNGTQNEVLYVPMFYGDLQGVTYSGGTLTITLADKVPAIKAGDKLFVKLYSDEGSSGETYDEMLAKFFGVTGGQGYEFMTDTEVTGEIEDIMQAIDNELTPEQAASITAETMNIINHSQS